MPIGFDADQDCSDVAADAVDAGVEFVCRYLKNLTRDEVAALTAAGLKIVSIFESTAERALAGARAGQDDGVKALAQAAALGQPTGSAIYATADFDVTDAQQSDVLAYFSAFKSSLVGQGKLGVYSNGAICQAALDAGIADYTWLAAGMRWRGSRDFCDAEKWTILQDVGNKQGLRIRLAIDSNTASSEDYGGWQPHAKAAPPSPAPQPAAQQPATPFPGEAAASTAIIRAFQSARGLDPDGIAGPLTWAAFLLRSN